jgi:hypothetical protein
MSGVKECTPNMQLREAAFSVFIICIICGGQKKGVAFFSYWCVAFLARGFCYIFIKLKVTIYITRRQNAYM